MRVSHSHAFTRQLKLAFSFFFFFLVFRVPALCFSLVRLVSYLFSDNFPHPFHCYNPWRHRIVSSWICKRPGCIRIGPLRKLQESYIFDLIGWKNCPKDFSFPFFPPNFLRPMDRCWRHTSWKSSTKANREEVTTSTQIYIQKEAQNTYCHKLSFFFSVDVTSSMFEVRKGLVWEWFAKVAPSMLHLANCHEF